MSQDYTASKGVLGGIGTASPVGITPSGAQDTAFQRLEPLLTPELLRQRHLFGIPLVSAIKDPLTGKKAAMTDDIIRDYIVGAVSDAELETATDIFPVKYNEKYPFDRAEYNSLGYFRVNHRPVYSVDGVFVTPANNVDVFTIPLDWVETANLIVGQINLIPLGITLTGSSAGVVTGVGAGAAAFLAIMANQYWIPAFWRIQYTTGYPDAMVPRYINDLVGICAAIKILSMLASTYRSSSASIGVDGLSQSVSTPGPQVFDVRIAKLEEEKKKKIKLVKKLCGFSIFSGNV